MDEVAVCRGCWLLGTACGRCGKCRATNPLLAQACTISKTNNEATITCDNGMDAEIVFSVLDQWIKEQLDG